MSNRNVSKSKEVNLEGKDDDSEAVQMLYEDTELARRLQCMNDNHDVAKNILDSMEAKIGEMINHMTFKQQNIANVVKCGISDMKDQVTALKAIRDQQVKEKNGIEHLFKRYITGSVQKKRKRSEKAENSGKELTKRSAVGSSPPKTPSSLTMIVDPVITETNIQGQSQTQPGTQEGTTDGNATTHDTGRNNVPFQRVVNKRKERKKKKKEGKRGKDEDKSRPNATKKKKTVPRKRDRAVAIKLPTGRTYADILGAIRTQVQPEELGAKIRSVRKTKTGDVLVELKEPSDKIGSFSQEVRRVLGEQAKVRDLAPKRVIQILDLDCLTQPTDVLNAVKGKLEDAEITRVTISKSNAREQRAAYVDLDEGSAFKLVRMERIKIGWMNCRVRLRSPLTRCFKCLRYGHIATKCNGPDRRGKCYKCGADGHKAADCTAKPRCMLCLDLGLKGKELKHDLGKGKCEALRRALEKLRSGADSSKSKNVKGASR